jgi:hypothetical protein
VKRFVSRETYRWLFFDIFVLKAFFPSWGDYREERFEEGPARLHYGRRVETVIEDPTSEVLLTRDLDPV